MEGKLLLTLLGLLFYHGHAEFQDGDSQGICDLVNQVRYNVSESALSPSAFMQYLARLHLLNLINHDFNLFNETCTPHSWYPGAIPGINQFCCYPINGTCMSVGPLVEPGYHGITLENFFGSEASSFFTFGFSSWIYPSDVVDGWITSPGHYQTMISNSVTCGAAILEYTNGDYFTISSLWVGSAPDSYNSFPPLPIPKYLRSGLNPAFSAASGSPVPPPTNYPVFQYPTFSPPPPTPYPINPPPTNKPPTYPPVNPPTGYPTNKPPTNYPIIPPNPPNPPTNYPTYPNNPPVYPTLYPTLKPTSVSVPPTNYPVPFTSTPTLASLSTLTPSPVPTSPMTTSTCISGTTVFVIVLAVFLICLLVIFLMWRIFVTHYTHPVKDLEMVVSESKFSQFLDWIQPPTARDAYDI